jgi:hypothetical protein
MGINHGMKLFSLPSNGFTIINAKLKDKQLIGYTYLKGLRLPPQGLINKQALRALCSTSVFLNKCQEGALVLRKAPPSHRGPSWIDYSPAFD